MTIFVQIVRKLDEAVQFFVDKNANFFFSASYYLSVNFRIKHCVDDPVY